MGILERVWNPSAELYLENGSAQFVEMLETLLAVPLVAIYDTSKEARQEPLAVFADTEVMPNASLADVLYEERGISVDEDAVVLFIPSAIACEAVAERLAAVLSQLIDRPKPSSLPISICAAAEPIKFASPNSSAAGYRPCKSKEAQC